MFEREQPLYAFLLDYARKLVEGVEDDRFAVEPAPGMNHPAWILGHLAICTDLALKQLGKPARCPEGWMELLGPGSKLQADRSAYPGKAELLNALAEGHEHVAHAASEADPSAMDEPHQVPIRFVRQWIPTVGVLVTHLMTTHEATHLGQLSAWRRAQGMPGVLQL